MDRIVGNIVPNIGIIQPDWPDVTEERSVTNHNAYSLNDPVNKLNPNGNLFGLGALITTAIGALATHSAFFAGIAVFAANVGFLVSVASARHLLGRQAVRYP